MDVVLWLLGTSLLVVLAFREGKDCGKQIGRAHACALMEEGLRNGKVSLDGNIYSVTAVQFPQEGRDAKLGN
jgi:hypothetical protein